MDNIVLAHPFWLLLALLPLAAALAIRTGIYKPGTGIPGFLSGQRFRHPGFDNVVTTPGMKAGTTRTGTAINWLTIMLLALAMSQPQQIGKKLPDPPQQRDIVFIIDTSVSMLLRDYLAGGKRISRMTILKNVLRQFVRQLDGNRMGIIVFADSVHTLLPMTTDQHLAISLIGRIEAGIAGRSKALGDAIALATKQALSSKSKRRILIVFSDASRTSGNILPEHAADLAREHKLRIYTVAIGAGVDSAREKQSTGLIYDTVNLDRLQRLATHTGGKLYQAGNTAALHKAIMDIEKIERDPVRKKDLRHREALYHWPLLLAILLLLAFQSVSITRRHGL